jgi:hypothetical protein
MLHVLRRFLVWLGLRREDSPPGRDPYARKPAPLKPHPKGRSSSVALAEPDDD